MNSLKKFSNELLTINDLSEKLQISKEALSQYEAQKYLISPLNALKTNVNCFNRTFRYELKEFFDFLSDFSKQVNQKVLLGLEDSASLSKPQPEKFSSEIDSLVASKNTLSKFGQIKSKFKVITTEFINADMKFQTFQARINGMLEKHSEEKVKLEKMGAKNKTQYIQMKSRLNDLKEQTNSLKRNKEELEIKMKNLDSQITNQNVEIIKNSKVLEQETEQHAKKLKDQLDLQSEIFLEERELDEQKDILHKERIEKSSCQSKLNNLKEELESYQRRKSSEISSLRSKRDELEEKKKAGAIVGTVAGIGSLFLAPFTLGGSVAAYTASVAAMIAAIKHYSDEIDNVYDEINSNRRYYDSKIADKTKELEQIETKITSLVSEIWCLNYRIDSKKDSLEKKYNEVSETQRKLEECKQNIKDHEKVKVSLEHDFQRMKFEERAWVSEIKEKEQNLANCQNQTQKLQFEISTNEKLLQEIEKNIKMAANCLIELEKLTLPKEFLEGVNRLKEKIDNFEDKLIFISNEFEKNLIKIKKTSNDFMEAMEMDDDGAHETWKKDIKSSIENINFVINNSKHSLFASDYFLML